MVETVEHPVIAGSLRVMEEMLGKTKALNEFNRFMHILLSGTDSESFRALVSASSDFVQMLPGDENTVALTRALAVMIASNGNTVVENGGSPIVAESALWQNLTLTSDSVELDETDVLARVMANLIQPVGKGSPSTAMDLYLEAITEVNRVTPGSNELLSAADWDSIISEILDLLRDDRRGVERLFELVRCREAPEDDASCN